MMVKLLNLANEYKDYDIHYKDNKVNIKEQKLEKFERFGFCVVEWGGMTY